MAFRAGGGSKGAGSTITNQHGLYIVDQAQGTNNYGITSLVSSGTNKWNIYASGTAANYFAGNLGIGISTPVRKLNVFDTTSTPVRIETNTADTKIEIITTSGTQYIQGSVNNLLFGTNNTERMRIDSSGNLGLGVTPSAWNTNVKAIQFGTRGAVYTGTGGQTNVGNNVILGAGGNTYLATAAATVYAQDAGAHQWYTAPSGTAGNAISFTQAMTLFASGSLWLGASSEITGGQGVFRVKRRIWFWRRFFGWFCSKRNIFGRYWTTIPHPR